MKVEKMLETFLAKHNIIVLYWEKDIGWELLQNGCEEIDDKYLHNGIFDLVNIISDSDKIGFNHFTNTILSRMTGDTKYYTPNINVLDSIFLFNTNNGSAYYKIVCYTNDVNKSDSILIRIEMLSSEESYRYKLAKTITNDKHPDSFISEVNHIFKLYPDEKFALIQFDVENFKLINQQYGEHVGNDILNYFINSLKFICVKETQLYARLTADVFMILTSYSSKKDLIKFVKYLNDLLLGYNNIPYTLKFGISKVYNKKDNLRKYGDKAALARQSIKNNALKYYEFYNTDMNNKNANKWIENSMEKALENHEFVMYLQPKYSIATNTIVGAEALARWIHPEKGLISPADFIPIFEKNGFIIKLDEYIWEEACKCLHKWKKEGKPLVPISVNVSRKHMIDKSYLSYLEKLLKKYNIDKQYLELEITETVDDIQVNQNILLLKEKGFTLLMDDFGSGYSSLNMLKDTQFDVIKIDREFLTDFIESDRGKSIVKYTISMTKEIGLQIIAEGVESLEQANFLSDCGCDTVQGFYFAKPMPVEDFTNLNNKEKT